MTLERQALGKSGEDAAVVELGAAGTRFLRAATARRHGEIDVVARDGETTVFVEVKARTTAEFGTAAEAVTPGSSGGWCRWRPTTWSRHRLTERPCRFDVVAIDVIAATRAGRGAPAVTIYRNAFDA